ncbi:MAG: TrmH family RNA methyltransferase [Gammaproteobacteria bacterium WSBS_2016_MAG_OTU1]
MKKQRSNYSGEIMVCGIRAVQAVLDCGRARHLWADMRTDSVQQILQQAKTDGVECHTVSAATLSTMVDGAIDKGAVAHQGVVASAVPPPAVWKDLLNEPYSPLAILDGVTDTRNLGAVMRVARAFNAAGVVLPARNSAALTAATAKAAAGAAAFLPIFRVSNLRRALLELRDAGWFLAGASEDAPQTILSVDFDSPIGWVLGGESSGLRRLTKESCDVLVRVPTVAGDAGCLNVATACAACFAMTAAKNSVQK